MATPSTALPTISRASGDPATATADVLVVAFHSGEDGAVPAAQGLAKKPASALAAAAAAVGHTGKAGAVARIPAPTGVRAGSVVLAGLGAPSTDEDPAAVLESLRRAAGTALRGLSDVESVALAFPVTDAATAEAAATGALLGSYRYTAYLSDGGSSTSVRSLSVIAPSSAQAGLDRAATVARAAADARDLVNQPPLDLYPESFAQAVVDQAAGSEFKKAKVRVEVLDEDTLRDRGFGGLIGVGGGSTRGPRLVKVSYTPKKASTHLALVGKGITFDSGGISLKPAAKMEEMKSDMAGAAAASQALFAIARLGLPVRVTAWLALAENMPSATAQRPADVLRIYGGKTVEVTNTDAEGRLVLADALVAAQEESPDLVVDIATLTGAQIVALGARTSGVMGTDAARNRLVLAAEASGEPFWPMPIPEEMLKSFDSTTADLTNSGGRAGGMLAAAAFLREFVADGVEWAHLDIAGPSYNAEAPHGYTVKGGTGVPVRTLVELADQLAGA
ncbi:MAG TPA: leucyl aminopeptidase [Brevibacterium senegalense]|uniref:Probable cytosol aminopeptidase n=1 Tax=Brevibacterium senegalense TaxID=1033736 RepID=A0A921SMM4_9MICO|nr:leucyl aminopeptidase [Brevibacterium senegalense]